MGVFRRDVKLNFYDTKLFLVFGGGVRNYFWKGNFENKR